MFVKIRGSLVAKHVAELPHPHLADVLLKQRVEAPRDLEAALEHRGQLQVLRIAAPPCTAEMQGTYDISLSTLHSCMQRQLEVRPQARGAGTVVYSRQLERATCLAGRMHGVHETVAVMHAGSRQCYCSTLMSEYNVLCSVGLDAAHRQRYHGRPSHDLQGWQS